MKWCHRAIRDKLKQGSGMCEPFGMPLVETPAAYSSRFCSRTGVAGFRATELSGDPLKESKWRWRVRKPEDEKTETKDQIKRREQWELLFKQVREANDGRDNQSKEQQLRTLLVPDAGGSIFIPISKLNDLLHATGQKSSRSKTPPPNHRIRAGYAGRNQTKQPRLIHADINAAVNLGATCSCRPAILERAFPSPFRAQIRRRGKNQEGKGKTHGKARASASASQFRSNATPDIVLG